MNQQDIIDRFTPTPDELAYLEANWANENYRRLMLGVLNSPSEWVRTCSRRICFVGPEESLHELDIPGSAYPFLSHLRDDVDLLPLAIDEGCDPAEVFWMGDTVSSTALGAAVHTGRVDLCRALLTNIEPRFPALPDISEEFDMKYHYRSPLRIAVAARNFELVQLLLEEGADPNRPDTRAGTRPLDKAYKNADRTLVHFLFVNGADPNLISAYVLARYGTPEDFESFIANTGYSLSAPRDEHEHVMYALASLAFSRPPGATQQEAIDKILIALRLGADISQAGSYAAPLAALL